MGVVVGGHQEALPGVWGRVVGVVVGGHQEALPVHKPVGPVGHERREKGLEVDVQLQDGGQPQSPVLHRDQGCGGAGAAGVVHVELVVVEGDQLWEGQSRLAVSRGRIMAHATGA